jgi:cell division protease FtsH
MTVGDKMGEVFLGAQMQELGSVGPATLDLIDREVEATMREASRLARLVLETNWTAVLEAADALIEHESLSGLALEAVLATTKPVQVGPARNRGDEDQGSDRPYSGAHPSD